MRIVWHQQTLAQEKMNTLVCLQCTYGFPNPILFDYNSEVLNRLNNLFLAIGGTVFFVGVEQCLLYCAFLAPCKNST